MLKFEIVDQNGNKSFFEFGVGSYTLGKGDKCDVILADHHVSRLHARIEVEVRSAVLVDLDSTNGTWVKGKRLSQPLSLAEEDEVQLGDLRLVVISSPGNELAELDGVERRAGKGGFKQESEQLVALKRRVHSLILEYLDLRKQIGRAHV